MTKFIKHRGIFNKDIKENSYAGIKEAFENPKYFGVEFDVRETKDKEFILYHDPVINGKLIKDLKYSELPKYVPKLTEILKINSNKIFLIELKNITTFPHLIKILKKYSYHKLYIMSFYKNLIEPIAIKNRPYKIGLLNYVLNTSNKKYDFLALLDGMINKNTLELCKDIEVFSYGLSKNKKDYPYASVYYIIP